MGIKLFFLGTFQVLRHDNLITSFRSVNVQGLLAYLAIEADRPHTRESLATLFWPDAPDEIAKQNLRQTLYLLRKSLEEQAEAQPYLLVSRATVRFNPESDTTLDVAKFDAALAAGDLEAAAACYRGDLLAGLYCESIAFEEWMVMLRERLHHQALEIFHRLAQQYLSQDDYEQARTYALRQLEMEPWREAAHRQMMHILVAAGERNAALAQYERCRKALADQMGFEPSSLTTDLYDAIRNGTGNAAVAPTLLSTPPRAPKHNLPPGLTPFVGRSEEVRMLADLLQSDVRLVTLLGEGGIGKTRLALAAAERLTASFADGVRFVPLAGVMQAKDSTQDQMSDDHLQDGLVTAIADACRLPFAGEETLAQRLFHHLQPREMLLVLDNFEHLVGAAAFVVALLQHAPSVTILLTSRMRLNARAEHILHLQGLPVPQKDNDPHLRGYSSIQLFIQSAQRSLTNLALDNQTLRAIGQICRHVQGIPLGIELAAALVDEMTPMEIKVAIEQNLDVLVSSQIDLPPRHHSLRAVFDSSWQLLSEQEEALLAQLSVFVADFSRAAALAVTQANPAALTALTHKSLLRRQTNGRYALHALLRQFAAEKLEQRGEAASVQREHAFYYLHFVAQNEGLLGGENSPLALADVNAEMDNVRQAWSWAFSHGLWRALDIGVNGLARFLSISGLYVEGERAIGRAIEALQKRRGDHLVDEEPREEDETDLAILLGTLQAWHAFFLGTQARYDDAVTAALAAIALGEKRAFVPVIALGYLHWGMALWYAGEVAHAHPLVQRALSLAQADGLRSIEIDSLRALGSIALRVGDNAQAMDLYRRGLHIARKIGDRHRESQALHSLGGVARNLGDYRDARMYLEQSLQIYQNLEDRQGESSALNTLGDTAYYQGHYMAARSYYQHSLEIAEEIDERRQTSMVLTNLGILHRDLGDYFTAESYLDRALALKETIGFRRGEGWVWICMALLRHQRSADEDALSYSRRALSLFQTLGDQIGQAYALTQCGHAFAGLKQWEDADQAYQQALALRHELKQPHLALDLKAGMARIALIRGEIGQAMMWVESILSFLQDGSINGTDEPARIYLTCYQVLTAVHDPRATAVLLDARDLLRERAMRISDLDLRRTYLEAVPAHQQIMSAVALL